jgi:hypothetical protein
MSNHSVGINFLHNQGDLDIVLYDKDGNFINSSQGVSDREKISLAGLDAGTYFLQVYGYSGETNPNYNLFLTLPESQDWAEANDIADNAFDLRNVEGLQSWNPLSIDAKDDVDWFKFTFEGMATKEHYASILFDQTLGDLEFYLYNATGTTEIASSQTADNLERVDLERLEAGTYLLKVVGYNQATNPNYQLVINAPTLDTGDWAEENNTEDNAYQLREVQGTQAWSGLSLHQEGDEDWFSFSTIGQGLAGHSVSIEFDNTQGNLSLLLIDPDGNEYTSQSNSNRERIYLENLPKGDYLVKVFGEGEANPNYSLIIDTPQTAEVDWIDKKSEKNDTKETAYNLRNIDGSLVLSGLSIHPDTDQDWFKFTLDKDAVTGQVVRIDFNNAEGNLQLELFDADGNSLGKSNTNKNFEEISLAEKSAGTYYVKVTGVDEAENPEYSLTVDGTPQASPDALEPNDSPDDAYELRDLVEIVIARSVPAAPLSPIFNP